MRETGFWRVMDPWRRALVLPIAMGIALPGVLLGQNPSPEAARVPVPIFGEVLDFTTAEPVVAARITISSIGVRAATSWEGITDERGRFRTRTLEPGRYRVQVSAFGYRAIEEAITIIGPSPVELRAELVPQALELEGVVVTSRRRSVLEARGFYQRRENGIGHTLTREEIEARYPAEVTDLIRTIPGVQVGYGSSGRAQTITMRGGCVPDVYVDGVLLVGPLTLDEVVLSDDLEGLEIYRGPNAPVEFTRSGCGTILAWTREPGARDGNPFSWKRLGVAAIFVALAVFATN